MRFFNLNERSYKKYFIEGNEFSIRKPIKVIKNDNCIELIDSFNPFYYLSMSLFLSFELIDKLLLTLVSYFNGVEKKQENNLAVYLLSITVNLLISAIGFTLILAPALVTAALLPLPLFFASGLPTSFFMAVFCFSINCIYWSKFFSNISGQKPDKKAIAFSDITIKFRDFVRKKKEDCHQVREGLRQLEADEQAYVNSCKQKYSESAKEFDVILSSGRSDIKEDIEHIYKLKMLYELLCSYPSLDEMEEKEYTYEVLKDHISDALEHHEKVMTLSPIVLEQGYERLNFTKREEVKTSSPLFTI